MDDFENAIGREVEVCENFVGDQLDPSVLSDDAKAVFVAVFREHGNRKLRKYTLRLNRAIEELVERGFIRYNDEHGIHATTAFYSWKYDMTVPDWLKDLSDEVPWVEMLPRYCTAWREPV